MFEKTISAHEVKTLARLNADDRRKQLGQLGEKIVAGIYSEQGYVVVGRNVHTGRYGELDVVAVRKNAICFIEVKTRTSSRFGSAIESVSVVKVARIQNAVHFYLRSHKEYEGHIPYLHFAAVAVDLDKSVISVTIVDN